MSLFAHEAGRPGDHPRGTAGRGEAGRGGAGEPSDEPWRRGRASAPVAGPSGRRVGPADWMTAGVPGRRVLGWLVDVLLAGALTVGLHASVVAAGFLTLGLGWGLLPALPLVPFAYSWLFVSAVGATPGMGLAGIAACDERDGATPDLLQGLLWTGGFWVTVAMGWIWLAVMLVSPRRRTLHDMLAGVVVVRAEARPLPLPGQGR